MQVDGEPWVQDVPSSKDAEPVTVSTTALLQLRRLRGCWAAAPLSGVCGCVSMGR